MLGAALQEECSAELLQLATAHIRQSVLLCGSLQGAHAAAWMPSAASLPAVVRGVPSPNLMVMAPSVPRFALLPVAVSLAAKKEVVPAQQQARPNGKQQQKTQTGKLGSAIASFGAAFWGKKR